MGPRGLGGQSVAGTPPEGRDRVGVGVGWCPAALFRAARPGGRAVGTADGDLERAQAPSVPPLRNIGAPSRCVCKRANESPHVWSLRPRNGGDGAWACGGSRAATPLRLTSTPALPPGVRGAGLGGVGGAADGASPASQLWRSGDKLPPVSPGQTRTEPAPPGGVAWGRVGGGVAQWGCRGTPRPVLGSLRAHEPPSHLSFYLCPWPCPSDNQGVSRSRCISGLGLSRHPAGPVSLSRGKEPRRVAALQRRMIG